jgi:hypothetical protein
VFVGIVAPPVDAVPKGFVPHAVFVRWGSCSR